MNNKVLSFLIVCISSILISSEGCSSSTQICENCEGYEYLIEYGESIEENTNQIWSKVFQDQLNKVYTSPEVIYFNGQISNSCAQNKSGTHYCPYNDNVYIDLPFMERVNNRMTSPGNFGFAYIMAHEMGHHIQDQLGIVNSVVLEKDDISAEEYNDLLVRLELQADFLAGVWAHHSYLETDFISNTDDLIQAIEAANISGDDFANPNRSSASYRHGTSEQRRVWLLKGLQTGDMNEGNTFVVDL